VAQPALRRTSIISRRSRSLQFKRGSRARNASQPRCLASRCPPGEIGYRCSTYRSGGRFPMLWTCPHCGAAVDASADRCWACKQSRPEPEPGSQAVSIPVSEPGREVAPADPNTESGSETGPGSTSVWPVSGPSAVSATESWICSRCGETVDAGFLVCWSCGTSIDGVEDPSFVSANEMAADADETQAITFLDDDLEGPGPGKDPRRCFRCQGPLEPGFIADFQHGHTVMSPSEWIAGTPQPSFWSGTWTGDRRYPIQAFRCRHCGSLELWADER